MLGGIVSNEKGSSISEDIVSGRSSPRTTRKQFNMGGNERMSLMGRASNQFTSAKKQGVKKCFEYATPQKKFVPG